MRGVSRPLLILTAGWIGGAACDVYGGTELPLPGFAQAGEPPAGGSASIPGTPPDSSPDGGDVVGGNGGTSPAPSAGSSAFSADAGSADSTGGGAAAENGGTGGAADNGGAAGASGTAGFLGAAGNGGKTGGGGIAGAGGSGATSACIAHPLTQRATWTATASSSDNGSPPSNILDG